MVSKRAATSVYRHRPQRSRVASTCVCWLIDPVNFLLRVFFNPIFFLSVRLLSFTCVHTTNGGWCMDVYVCTCRTAECLSARTVKKKKCLHGWWCEEGGNGSSCWKIEKWGVSISFLFPFSMKLFFFRERGDYTSSYALPPLQQQEEQPILLI